MGKHTLRDDKTCLNCQHVVEERFCPNCGQENKETRESFHYLFTHFFEDLTHYDGSFWKTIKYLLFYPAKLTKEYLSGKRQQYVPPVRLYIFISFLTFLLLSLLAKNENNEPVKITEGDQKSIKAQIPLSELPLLGDYKSVAQFDSIQETLPVSKRASGLEHWVKYRMAKISEENTLSEFFEKFKETTFHNFPKVIFLYMPLFAWILWLFHNKKRWYYFDHGIFTLHYFSMLLLSFTTMSCIKWFLAWFGQNSLTETILGLTITLMLFWWVFYFFRSHRRLYLESKLVSRVKGTAIFFINFILVFFFLICFLAYSALNVN